ncbi:hypothetical protein ACKKBG_A31135 [Auxenochlorella protothecoides x Auxenochlorella symbiontica]
MLGKRFAIDTPNILMSLSDNAVPALTSQIDTDRSQLAAQLKAPLPSMQAGWQARGPGHAGAGLTASPSLEGSLHAMPAAAS